MAECCASPPPFPKLALTTIYPFQPTEFQNTSGTGLVTVLGRQRFVSVDSNAAILVVVSVVAVILVRLVGVSVLDDSF